jgi:hypothetical protein
MAVHLASGSDYLQRTADLLDPTADSTVMGWARLDPVAASPAYQTPYILLDDPGVYADSTAIFASDALLNLDVFSGSDASVPAPAPTAGTWFHWAWVQEGTTQRLYINGALIGSTTKNRAGFVVGFELLGSDTFSEGGVDLQWFRSWQAALTVEQIRAEMGRASAALTDDLFMDTPLERDLNDISGNDRDWTPVGTVAIDGEDTTLGLGLGRKQPRRWVFFALDQVPPDDPPLLYRWASRPMAYQAFPAFIEGRVPIDGWLDINRAASSMSGEYNIDTGGVLLNDSDALIGALLYENATQWFLGRQASFLLISAAALAAGLTPGRLLFAGPCTDVQIADERRAQLEFEDILAKYMDRTYPQYTLGDAYPFRFTDPPDDVTEDLNTEDPGLQIPFVMRDQVIPIYYGPFEDTAEEPPGLCAVFFMGYTFLTAGTGELDEPSPEQAAIMENQGIQNGEGWGGWGELVVGLGEIQVPNVYGHNLSIDDPKTAIIADDRFNTEFLAPGHPGWPFDTNYVMRNGYRVTVIYARGPALFSHLTGGPKIQVDVCGWPDLDGVMIDQAAYVYQDFLTQHVLAHDGAGYTAGPSVDLPIFPPTISEGRAMFWTSKIQAFQAMTAERLETEKGYLCSMPLTKPTALREILRTFHVTFDCFSAKNGAGQLYIFGIDDRADPTAGVPIRERIELQNLPAPRIAWSEIENEIDYTYGWHPANDAPRTTTITIRNQDAIDALKEVRKVQGVRNLMYTADDATADDTMTRRLRRLKRPPIYQPLPVRTDGVDREIGEQCPIWHRDGIGPNGVGYAGRPFVLMKHQHKGDNVTLEALDVSRLLADALEDLPT